MSLGDRIYSSIFEPEICSTSYQNNYYNYEKQEYVEDHEMPKIALKRTIEFALSHIDHSEFYSQYKNHSACRVFVFSENQMRRLIQKTMKKVVKEIMETFDVGEK